MKEIERKYLVKSAEWKTGLQETNSSLIQQGYLNSDPERVVRVRIRDTKAYLTIKSRSVGITRSEYEYAIPLKDAMELMEMCLGKILLKRRYLVDFKGMTWEVDEFYGDFEGLVFAEVELESEEQSYDVPPWVGEDVSDDPKYSNMAMALL